MSGEVWQDHLNSCQNGRDPLWKGTYANEYYRLAQMDGKNLMGPINGKWLKRYYS